MDFEIGDRICKVSGINSGKSGTIRSVLPNGTVGVVFDGEKTVRYCDPGNCAKPTMIPVVTNAKFRKGDVVYLGGVEKMEVMAPTDAYGWTKCKYLEGSRKGMVFDMPTPELKPAKKSRAANAKIEVDGSKLKFTDKTGKWHGPFKSWDELEREMGKYGISLNYETVTNAATDAEFEKIKAMGKTAGDKYFRDNYQSFIDKYGFKDALELGKRISRIKYKPIKKGRYSGKGPDGMTYYVDYTSDRWFAKKYGKDGTNVTAIQIQGPWVKDPNGKDRRHILYLYEGGSESIHPANPAVEQLVKLIMRGPDVLKQDAADYAWNEEVTSSNPVVANALKAARGIAE